MPRAGSWVGESGFPLRNSDSVHITRYAMPMSQSDTPVRHPRQLCTICSIKQTLAGSLAFQQVWSISPQSAEVRRASWKKWSYVFPAKPFSRFGISGFSFAFQQFRSFSPFVGRKSSTKPSRFIDRILWVQEQVEALHQERKLTWEITICEVDAALWRLWRIQPHHCGLGKEGRQEISRVWCNPLGCKDRGAIEGKRELLREREAHRSLSHVDSAWEDR